LSTVSECQQETGRVRSLFYEAGQTFIRCLSVQFRTQAIGLVTFQRSSKALRGTA